MKKFTLMLALMLTTMVSHATAILHYVDSDSGLFGAALSELGLTATTTSHGAFLSDLNSQEWDLVVVDTPGSPVSAANTAALDSFITGGGKSIVSHWLYNNNTALANAYDVSVTASFNSPLDVFVWDTNHPIFAGVTGITDYDRDAGDNGDRFSTINGSVALAGFTAGETATDAAIVLGNNGNTIANGWLFWDAELTQNNIQLVANQVDFLLGVVSVPAPAGFALMMLCLAGIGLSRRNQRA